MRSWRSRGRPLPRGNRRPQRRPRDPLAPANACWMALTAAERRAVPTWAQIHVFTVAAARHVLSPRRGGCPSSGDERRWIQTIQAIHLHDPQGRVSLVRDRPRRIDPTYSPDEVGHDPAAKWRCTPARVDHPNRRKWITLKPPLKRHGAHRGLHRPRRLQAGRQARPDDVHAALVARLPTTLWAAP